MTALTVGRVCQNVGPYMGGGLHSIEVAFVLLTKQPHSQFLALPRFIEYNCLVSEQ